MKTLMAIIGWTALITFIGHGLELATGWDLDWFQGWACAAAYFWYNPYSAKQTSK